MGVKAWLSGMVPIAAMVMVECLDVGLTTLSKAAMSRGMDRFVFVVYSNAFASLILFSISFIFLRSLFLFQSLSFHFPHQLILNLPTRNKTHVLFFYFNFCFSFGFAEQRDLL